MRREPNRETRKAMQEIRLSQGNKELLESIEQLQPTSEIIFGNNFHQFKVVFNAIKLEFYQARDKEWLMLDINNLSVKNTLKKYIIEDVCEETDKDTPINFLANDIANKLSLVKILQRLEEDY